MNPGSFTDRHTPTRPAMPAAHGEESERAMYMYLQKSEELLGWLVGCV